MEELTQEQQTELRRALEALQLELESSIAEVSESEAAQPVDLDSPIGRVTRIDAIQQQSMAKANLEAAKRRLNLVTVAMKAFDEGTYGECRECGELINIERLRARPESLLCLECQEDREQR